MIGARTRVGGGEESFESGNPVGQSTNSRFGSDGAGEGKWNRTPSAFK